MYENKTPADIQLEMIQRIGDKLQTMEGSFTGDMIAPVAREIWKLYLSLSALEPMFYVDETSGIYLDKQAAMFGITRKIGSNAVCVAHFLGTDGTVIPNGTVFETASGLRYILTEDVTIAGGSGNGSLLASEIGQAYNIAADTPLRAISQISGLSIITHGAASGGMDAESNAAFCARYYDFLRRPATSGNGYHYQQWMTAVNGVGHARIVKLWDGPGSVLCIAADANYHHVDADVVESAQLYVDEQRPIGPEVTVQSVAETSINITATITKAASASIIDIKAAFSAAVQAYIDALVSLSFSTIINAANESLEQYGYIVVYNKIAALLVETDGVVDFTSMTVNGDAENIIVAYDHIPVLGEVAINEVST